MYVKVRFDSRCFEAPIFAILKVPHNDMAELKAELADIGMFMGEKFYTKPGIKQGECIVVDRIPYMVHENSVGLIEEVTNMRYLTE